VLQSQRDATILGLLQQYGSVTVGQISTQCHCSPITARRDLSRLEETGLLRRTHGGAIRLNSGISANGSHSHLSLETRTTLSERSDVLIVTPERSATTRLLLQRALRCGVPIIAESINLTGARTYVAINDYRAGVELAGWVARYAREHLGGQVRALDVSCSLPNTAARSRGFTDGLADTLPASEILLRLDGQGLRDAARSIVADALTVYPDVNVIFAINDDSAVGALDAYRAAGLDESRLLLVSFGLEGNATKDMLQNGGPYRAAIAMFPELVGRACVDAAVCAYHGCALPNWVETPHVLVTRESLERYYLRDPHTGAWSSNWPVLETLAAASTGCALLHDCRNRPLPGRIGWVQVFSSHEWYRNMRQAMQERSRALDIRLEIVDASHDLAQEIEALKRAIARAAARLINTGNTVILDAGITTAYLAQALHGRSGITIITNSISVLSELAGEPGITLVSTGGMVRHESRSLIGAAAETTFKDLRADQAFIACTGLSLKFGLSNTNMQETAVKRAMIAAAREVILLADHTKIGVESLVKVAPVDCLHRLITDSGVSPQHRLALTQQGIEVIIADDTSAA